MFEVEIDKHNHLVRIRHFGDFVKAELISAFVDLVMNWSEYSAEESLTYFEKFLVDTREASAPTLQDTDTAFHQITRERMDKLPFAKGFKIAILVSKDRSEEASERFRLVKEKPSWTKLDIQMFQSQNEANAFLGLPEDYGIEAKG